MCKTGPSISFWGGLARHESHALEVLWSGLCHLSSIVEKLEEDRLQGQPKSKEMMIMKFDSECDSGDKMLLNYFFWYSCSAETFLGLFIKAFSVREDPTPAIGGMRKFRNKVAAHLSYVQPRKDNQEAQAASLTQFVTWDSGRYSVGREVTADLQTGEGSPSDWGWELTNVHEELNAFIKRNLPHTST